MTNFVRGASILFRAKCTDPDGRAMTPTRAELTLSYQDAASGKPTKRTYNMVVVNDGVSLMWDSSVAAETWPVGWRIEASNATTQVAQDGILTLSAGPANTR